MCSLGAQVPYIGCVTQDLVCKSLLMFIEFLISYVHDTALSELVHLKTRHSGLLLGICLLFTSLHFRLVTSKCSLFKSCGICTQSYG